jgi:hypothetical protein
MGSTTIKYSGVRECGGAIQSGRRDAKPIGQRSRISKLHDLALFHATYSFELHPECGLRQRSSGIGFSGTNLYLALIQTLRPARLRYWEIPTPVDLEGLPVSLDRGQRQRFSVIELFCFGGACFSFSGLGAEAHQFRREYADPG